MAKDCSFDVVSEFDKQELVNAIDQVKRDLTSRFDLKNSNSSIELEADKAITITTNDEMKLRNIFEILQSKLVKRGISIKILDAQTIENALGGNVRQVFNLKKGLTQELAKKIEAGKVEVTLKTGEGGRTFGSVSSKEIATAVKEQMGYDIDKKKIQMKDAIKSLGTYIVPVKLHAKVTAELKVHVGEA